MAYRTRPGGDHGAGYVECYAMNPQDPADMSYGGDVWGNHRSHDGGLTARKRMYGYNVTTGGSVGPDLPTRALAYSKRLATAGTVFIGSGAKHNVSNGSGFFGVDDSDESIPIKKSTVVDGWGLNYASGLGSQPRPSGQQIVCDYDAASDVEAVYCLTPVGLERTINSASQTPGENMTKLAFTTSALQKSWRWLYQWDAFTLICVTWIYGNPPSQAIAATTTPAEVYVVSSGSTPMRTASPSQITTTKVTTPASATHINSIKLIGANVLAATNSGVYRLTNKASTWTRVDGGFFTTEVMAIGGGQSGAVWAVARNTSTQPTRSIAKSLDGGATWTWKVTATNCVNQLWADGQPWWLFDLATRPNKLNSNPNAGKGTPFVASDIEVDPSNPRKIIATGPPGSWQSHDDGGTWRPAMNGLNGAEKGLFVLNNGFLYCQDTDYVSSKSDDRYVTAVHDAAPPSFSVAGSLSRTVNGDTYAVSVLPAGGGLPERADITKNGVSIADDSFRNAAVNPESLYVDTAGTCYIAQSGGGILVVEDATDPQIPIPTATANPSSATLVTITWTQVATASAYKVKRDGVVIATVTTGTSYADSTVQASTTYTYSVAAVVGGVTGSYSAEVTVTTPSGSTAIRFPDLAAAAGEVIRYSAGENVDVVWIGDSSVTPTGGPRPFTQLAPNRYVDLPLANANLLYWAPAHPGDTATAERVSTVAGAEVTG